jgi:hypothetical protein
VLHDLYAPKGLYHNLCARGSVVCFLAREGLIYISSRVSRQTNHPDCFLFPFSIGLDFSSICKESDLRVNGSFHGLKDRYGEPERGSEWEPIKILLEGDGNSIKMNTASNTRLRLTTQVGQAHVATGVPLDLGTNTQPFDPRTQRNTKPRVH